MRLRCFLALDLEEEIRDRVWSLLRPLLNIEGLKCVEKENLHLTLKFLGELDENGVKETVERLGAVNAKQFDMNIAGVGAFPNGRFPRVVWVGAAGAEELVKKIEAALGLPAERFDGHITIVRVKKMLPQGLIKSLIEKNIRAEIGIQTVRCFALKKSTLTPKGPIYEDVKVFELG